MSGQTRNDDGEQSNVAHECHCGGTCDDCKAHSELLDKAEAGGGGIVKTSPAVKNQVKLTITQARRLLTVHSFPELITVNTNGDLIFNDANFRSEVQRKYLWANEPDLAEAWAHGEHTSDSNHKMPEGPGAAVAGPMAEAARDRKKKRTNNMVTANDKSGGKSKEKSQSRDGSGKFAGGPSDEQLQSMADEAGVSVDELRDQLDLNCDMRTHPDKPMNNMGEMPAVGGGTKSTKSKTADVSKLRKTPAAQAGSAEAISRTEQQTTRLHNPAPSQPNPVGNAQRCPNCGSMLDEDGDCENCGYTENAFGDQPRHGETGRYLPNDAGTGKGPAHSNAIQGHRETGYPGYSDPTAPSQPVGKPGNPDSGIDGRDMTDLVENPEDGDDDLDHIAHQPAHDPMAEQNSPSHLFSQGKDIGMKTPQPKPANNAKPCPLCGKIMSGDSCPCGYKMTSNRQEPSQTNNAFPPPRQPAPQQPAPQQPQQPAPDPHEQTKQAVTASVMSEHQPARGPALDALDHSGNGNSPDAAKAHVGAAKAHEAQATSLRKDGDHDSADSHDNAAALHRKAASLHKAQNGPLAANQENTTQTQNEHVKLADMSAEQRKAAAYYMDLDSASDKADSASDKAKKTGSKKANAEAHDAHTKAAAMHDKAGNKKMRDYHLATAKEHSGVSNMNLNRQQLLQILTANCQSEADKKAIHAMTTDSLRNMVGNATKVFAQGSNAEVHGPAGKSTQMGGEEDDDYNNEEDESKGNPQDRAEAHTSNSAQAARHWLATNKAPTVIVNAFNTMVRNAERAKAEAIAKFVRYMPNSARKQRLVANLSKLSLEHIQDYIAAVPDVEKLTANQFVPSDGMPMYGDPEGGYAQFGTDLQFNVGAGPNFMGMAGGPEQGPVINRDGGDDDTLDIPTLNYADIVEQRAREGGYRSHLSKLAVKAQGE